MLLFRNAYETQEIEYHQGNSRSRQGYRLSRSADFITYSPHRGTYRSFKGSRQRQTLTQGLTPDGCQSPKPYEISPKEKRATF